MLNTEQFIIRAKQVHGNKYDYSKVEYINSKTKVCIICPIHGEFWQTPNHHLNGYGCPICKSSKLELEIHKFLKNKIDFEDQKHFKWLGKLSLDFYIPSKNIAIECQGKQHFIPEGWSKTKSEKERVFKDIQKRDNKKRQLCEEHGIKILYYSNLGIVYPYEVYEDKDELLKKLI